METILLVVQIFLALGIIGLVLIQRTDQDSLGGLGGGSGGGVVSGRAKANFFTRLTAIMAALFMINSMALTILVARSGASSIIDKVEQNEPKEITVPTADKPAEEGVVPADAAKDVAPATDPAEEAPATNEKTVAPEKDSTAPVEEKTETPVTSEEEKPADTKSEKTEPETIEVPKAE